MKTITFTKLISVLIIVSSMMKLTNPLCTPPDTSWTRYTPTSPPVEFNGQSTSGGCSHTNCTKPAILGDGDRGTTFLNVTAIHAWNTNVSITFTFPAQVRVGGVNLYFYNIPTMNISLPYDTVLSTTKGFTIEGNQDLSQNNCRLCNMTLLPNETIQGVRFTIQFRFSNLDRINLLLLTEVELCTSATTRPVTTSMNTDGMTAANIDGMTTENTDDMITTLHTNGRNDINTTKTDPKDDGATVAGAIFTALLVTIIVAVVLAIIIFKLKRRNLKNKPEIANTDKPSPPAIPAQDRNSLDCTTVEKKETVKNKAYETTNTKVQNPSDDNSESTNNDPETGQCTSPLYAHVQKNTPTKKDNQEDESNPPSCDPLYAAVLNQPKRGGKNKVQLELMSYSIGYEDLDKVVKKKKKQVQASDNQQGEEIELYPEHMYTAVQKKKKQVQVSDDQQDYEIECYPEHVYSAVQKKKKNKPSKERIPLDERDGAISHTSF